MSLGALTPELFVVAFVVVGAVTLPAAPAYWRLNPQAGANLGSVVRCKLEWQRSVRSRRSKFWHHSFMVFEHLLQIPSAWISVHDRFAVHLFEGRVSSDEIDEMQRLGERWNARHPEKRVELVVIFPSDARLSHEERARWARVVKLGEAYRSATATVITADGILASLQRSMLTGLTMLAPPPHPSKVFGKVADAMEWLAPHLRATCNPSVNVDELAHALRDHLASFARRRS